MTEGWRKQERPALDEAALERLALSYVGRYATSRMRLITYLGRKLAERGWVGTVPADPVALAARLAGLGYIDDQALADARGCALARRGLGRRRVADAIDALGIARVDGADALDRAAADGWETALRYAERRRLGPFAAAIPDDAGRRRAFAAMVRAGHANDHIRRILSATPGCVPDRDGI